MDFQPGGRKMESVSSPVKRSRFPGDTTISEAKTGMNVSSILEEVGQLPVDEQIVLVQQIWDEIAKHRDLFLSDAKRTEMDRRLAAYQASPGDVVPWKQIREDRRKA